MPFSDPVPNEEGQKQGRFSAPVANGESQWSRPQRDKPTKPLDFRRYGDEGWLERRVTDVHNIGEQMRGRREAWQGAYPGEMWQAPKWQDWAKRTDTLAHENLGEAKKDFGAAGKDLMAPSTASDPQSAAMAAGTAIPRAAWDMVKGLGDAAGTVLSPLQAILEQIPGKFIEAKTGLSKEMVGNILSSVFPVGGVVKELGTGAKVLGSAAKTLGSAAKAGAEAAGSALKGAKAAEAATKVSAEVSGLEPLHQMRHLKHMIPER